MNTKYLFFDLDGTISFDGDTVAPRVLECLKRLRTMGHKVIINTGRGLSHISKKILNAIEWDGIIAGTGYVSFGGETLCNESLPLETVKKLYNFCKERNAAGIFEGVYTLYTSLPYPVTEVLLTDENIDTVHDVTCVTVIACIDETEAKRLFPEVTTVVMPRYFENNPKGFSKATGMELIGEKYQISPCDMIAFGDSENDEKMLRYAGTSVAIGNVPESFNEFVTHRAESTADALIEMFKL